MHAAAPRRLRHTYVNHLDGVPYVGQNSGGLGEANNGSELQNIGTENKRLVGRFQCEINCFMDRFR